MTDRSRLQEALESTRGTVTDLLEQLVGETIDAEAHRHHMIVASTSNGLEAAQGEPLLQRAATLRGRRSGSPYVYAESLIVTNRLPRRFCLRLESTVDPIGRILHEMGISISRKTLAGPEDVAASRLNGGIKVDEYILARTYRLDSEEVPLMVITEWFLRTLDPFLVTA